MLPPGGRQPTFRHPKDDRGTRHNLNDSESHLIPQDEQLLVFEPELNFIRR